PRRRGDLCGLQAGAGRGPREEERARGAVQLRERPEIPDARRRQAARSARRDRLREAVSINTTVMAGTSAGMTRGSRLARLPQEVDQVELRRLDAGMAEQAVHLAAMMGLVIEEMRQRREERIGEFVAPHVAVGEASRQRGGIEAVGEGDDLR